MAERTGVTKKVVPVEMKYGQLCALVDNYWWVTVGSVISYGTRLEKVVHISSSGEIWLRVIKYGVGLPEKPIPYAPSVKEGKESVAEYIQRGGAITVLPPSCATGAILFD